MSWEDDSVQFPRLLVEIMATQDTLDMKEIAKSMDLTLEDVNELFDRADHAWGRAKAREARDKSRRSITLDMTTRTNAQDPMTALLGGVPLEDKSR